MKNHGLLRVWEDGRGDVDDMRETGVGREGEAGRGGARG
jgi:hypothetical protein